MTTDIERFLEEKIISWAPKLVSNSDTSELKDLLKLQNLLIHHNNEYQRRISQLEYRLALYTCRQLLEDIADIIEQDHPKHGGVPRPPSCQNKKLSSISERLQHFIECDLFDQGSKQTILSMTRNEDIRQDTSVGLFKQLSAIVHSDMMLDDDTLIIPKHLKPLDRNLMAGLAKYNKLKIKVIDYMGHDCTSELLNTSNNI